MKKQLLFLIAFLSTAIGFAQATATQPPPMPQCNLEVFDLTTQTPIILGTQNPADFSVTYYFSLTDAENETNPIPNPTFVISAQGQPQTIYARVDSSLDTSFAITDFMIVWESAWVAVMPDQTSCDSFTLPALQSGSYFTSPNGTGAQLNPGDVITVTTTIYIFATSQTGLCGNETSFVVTIIPSPVLTPIDDVYSCEPYALPELPAGQNYQVNGMTISLPAIISETSVVSVVSGPNPCGGSTEFVVYVGEPVIEETTQYVICNNDGNGFGVFDLESMYPSINAGNSEMNIFFHETMTDALNGVNPISNVNDYVNIVSNMQVVYVRAVFGSDDSCFAIGQLNLMVTSCTENTISGNIRFDYDNNGCAATDPAAAGIPVMCTNGNSVVYAYTDSDGDYTFTNIQQGNNLVTPLTVPMNFTVAAPSSQTFNVSGNVNTMTADFCLLLANPVNDASVSVYATNAARPGFAATYVLNVQNVGSTMLSGTVTVTFDSGKLTFSNANPPQTSQTSNTVTFNYNNLMPLQNVNYNLSFNVATPPTANAGDILNFTSEVTTSVTDVNLGNNTFMFSQTVVNSYDPNDIMVLEGAYISEAQADGYLNYIVRFQNTGTANAVNVRITNKLDANLDWTTFMPIAASHAYQAERTEDEVTFKFDGIMLPASQDNELGSHGFIAYRIKPAMDFAEGEIISNTANIFFDFNAPIITNTVTTQIQTLGIPGVDADEFLIYPNPAAEYIVVQGLTGNSDVSVFDIQGKIISTVKIRSTGNDTVDISGFDSGMYFVKITSSGRTTTKKLVIK